jgi:pilus assembly protein CpaB
MSLRAIATLVIAVVLGLAAVLILNSVISRAPKPVAAGSSAPTLPPAPVVVAAKPIARGVMVTADLLKVVSFPNASAPDGAFAKIADVTGTGTRDTRRLATRDLSPGEPVLKTRVTAPGGTINLSDIISPGMQAVSLRTSDIQGVAGFILPGDHVDVFLTRNGFVQVVVENLKVVGIDQNNNDESAQPQVGKAITVEVTPQQAQTITLAQTLGAVSFSLRHVQDTGRLLRLATSAAALDLRRPAPERPRPSIPPGEDYGVVRVTRATDTTVYQLSAR